MLPVSKELYLPYMVKHILAHVYCVYSLLYNVAILAYQLPAPYRKCCEVSIFSVTSSLQCVHVRHVCYVQNYEEECYVQKYVMLIIQVRTTEKGSLQVQGIVYNHVILTFFMCKASFHRAQHMKKNCFSESQWIVQESQQL